MRFHVGVVPLAALAASILAVVACQDLNRPAAVPKSEPRTSCFTDVECPSSKRCEKTGNDIQGTCRRRGGDDAGAPEAPDPVVAPSPNDVRL